MALGGYVRQGGRCKGGITAIAVAPAPAVSAVRFDAASGNVAAVELKEGETFALYNFREDSARLTERSEMSAGFTLVYRELCFRLERLDKQEKQAVAELLKRSPGGYVVIVKNACGERFLLGWGRRLAGRFPMRVKSAEASTGYGPEDESSETVTLINEDDQKAPVYTGDILLST